MNSDARQRGPLRPQPLPHALALDDPVPAGSCTAAVAPEPGPPHDVEAEVQRVLLGTPELEFTSLVVRRVPQGVCLEGVVHGKRQTDDVADLARTVKGVDVVINHLLVCSGK